GLMTEGTYPAGHPYSWSVIGSMADLNAASVEDVKEWFRTYYGPNNAVIALAGDITPETARQKVEQFFGDIPATPPIAKQSTWIARRTGSHREIMQDRVPQARANFIRGVERIGGFGGKSDVLARNEVFTGSADHYLVTQRRIAAATAGNLKSAAVRWLSDGEWVLEVHPYPTFETAASGAD